METDLSTAIRGGGWWYDRIKQTYLAVEDHAQAVLTNPILYRVEDLDLGGADMPTEERRSRVIRLACARSFIRIRYHPRQQARLAWQFCGDPFDSLTDLKLFARAQDLAPETEVTFTDFSFRDLRTTVRALLSETGEVATYLNDWKVSRGVPP